MNSAEPSVNASANFRGFIATAVCQLYSCQTLSQLTKREEEKRDSKTGHTASATRQKPQESASELSLPLNQRKRHLSHL